MKNVCFTLDHTHGRFFFFFLSFVKKYELGNVFFDFNGEKSCVWVRMDVMGRACVDQAEGTCVLVGYVLNCSNQKHQVILPHCLYS